MPKAKITMQAKREAVAEAFGDVPNLDPAHLNFLYAGRNRATVGAGKAAEVQYVVEVQDLEQRIKETLDRIRARDGDKIFREAAEHVIEDVATVVQVRGTFEIGQAQMIWPLIATNRDPAAKVV